MSDFVLSTHLVVFLLSALICLGSVPQARKIQHQGTRRGFVVLLVMVGIWSLGYVGYLIFPSLLFKEISYLLGFSAAFVAVAAFLYLAATYTGRDPRQMPYRRTVYGIFVLILLSKVTNPWHHLYVSFEWTTDPFPHFGIHYHLMYWILLGLSYAVIAVGFFMFLERFYHTKTDTRPLIILLGITGIPAGVTIISASVPELLPLMYEPPGVALFAVGTLYVYLERFEGVQFTAQADSPVIFIGQDDRILAFNNLAVELIPGLQDSFGDPIHSVNQQIAAAVSDSTEIIEFERGENESPRIYQVSSRQPLEGELGRGTIITLADVSEREQYRRELEEKNERLEEFTSLVSHDIRNPLNVAQSRLELVALDSDSEHLKHVEQAHTRIEAMIEDLLTLAREGEHLGETEAVNVGELADGCWQVVQADGASLEINAHQTIKADRSRLQQLFENLFRNAIEHGRDDVTITTGDLDTGFYVEDDGVGIPEDERDEVFDMGFSTAANGTGFGLAIVKQVVDAHGWDIQVTEGGEGGVRFEITGVESSVS